MAVPGLRLSWFAIALLIWTQHTHSQEHKNEQFDIRKPLFSIIKTVTSTKDKLEELDYKVKILGEHIKKPLAAIEKKHESLTGLVTRLEKRVSNIETIFLELDKREMKTQEVLENIQKSLVSLTTTVARSLNPNTKELERLEKKINSTDAKMDKIKFEIENLHKDFNNDSLRAVCLEMVTDTKPLEKHLSDSEELLNRYEKKLNEYSDNATKFQKEFVPLNEVSAADEALHNKMAEVMERQEVEIKKIQTLLSDAESMWKDLPRKADLKHHTNETRRFIVYATKTIEENCEKSVGKVTTKLHDLGEHFTATNEDIQRSLVDGNVQCELAYRNITESYDSLKSELSALNRTERLVNEMTATMSNLNSQLEYLTQQIIYEVSRTVTFQSNKTNSYLNNGFDNLESTVKTQHQYSVHSLNAKLKNELAQVWQKVDTLSKQLKESDALLAQLTLSSTEYGLNSTATMKTIMENVESILTRMLRLEDNMNYTLGQLSLTSNDMSTLSTGFIKALAAVTSKSAPAKTDRDDSPGPHVIPNSS